VEPRSAGHQEPAPGQSARAQSALGSKPAHASLFGPTLWQLADRIGARLWAKSRPGRTVSVRVRFADPRSVSRSVTLAAPISATAMLAEIAEDLLRGVLAKHANERGISLLAIAVSNLLDAPVVQLELPLGLADEARRPGSKRGEMRALADRAVDVVRHRFGWEAVGYASLAAAPARSVPDDFRRLAEKEL
jgi:DNA polymerase IV